MRCIHTTWRTRDAHLPTRWLCDPSGAIPSVVTCACSHSSTSHAVSGIAGLSRTCTTSVYVRQRTDLCSCPAARCARRKWNERPSGHAGGDSSRSLSGGVDLRPSRSENLSGCCDIARRVCVFRYGRDRYKGSTYAPIGRSAPAFAIRDTRGDDITPQGLATMISIRRASRLAQARPRACGQDIF